MILTFLLHSMLIFSILVCSYEDSFQPSSIFLAQHCHPVISARKKHPLRCVASLVEPGCLDFTAGETLKKGWDFPP